MWPSSANRDPGSSRPKRGDPLDRARRLSTSAYERLDKPGEIRLVGLLRAGDHRGEVKAARHAQEVVRSIYQISDCELANLFVTQLAEDLQDESCQPEVNSLGRTLSRWHYNLIVVWHQARESNGPTEAINTSSSGSRGSAVNVFRFRGFRN